MMAGRPEGGFDDGERAAVRALPQARAISLGPRVLRGETAAIAGAARALVWVALFLAFAPGEPPPPHLRAARPPAGAH